MRLDATRRPGLGSLGDSARSACRRRGPRAARGVASASVRATPDRSRLGTYRDLWAGPITELNPPLRFLAPQQRVELSVADAERLGLKIGDEVEVAQNGTSVRAPRSTIKERVAEGTAS